MTTKVEFPIRTKLLLLMSVVVLAAIALYLALALELFKEDKKSLIYELNASTVRTLAAEVQAELLKIADKIKLLTQGHRDSAWSKAVLEAEPDLVSYVLYAQDSSGEGWQRVASVKNDEYIKLYGLDNARLEKLSAELPVPFAKILAKRSWVMNATAAGGAPILRLGMAVEIKNAGLASEHVAVADIRLDRLLKLLKAGGITTAYVVDGEGNVIAHPQSDLVTSRASLGEIPIVRNALESQVSLGAKTFDWNGKSWIGAYAAVGYGQASVVSQVEKTQAFRTAFRLMEKSALFAVFVLTVALLVSGWAARGLTQPLEKLLVATEKLARWEFGGSIHVKTRDEIARLARAFNAMASDLQNQRAQLEASKQELELKVKERTADLEGQKQQLFEAQDALVRTTRLASLGELAGIAAHEVLNPLNNMGIRIEKISGQMRDGEKGDLELLNEIIGSWKTAYESGGWEAFEKEARKIVEGRPLIEEDIQNLSAIGKDASTRLSERQADIEFLDNEMGRITKIVNGMRSLSRVGGERRPLDVHLPLDETATALSNLFEKKKIELVKDYAASSRDQFAVVADKDELVQVFSNLVRNAVQAIQTAKRRSGVIRVSTRRENNRIEIRITDNGSGIPNEHVPRVFEPSFTTKSMEEGTGLGLGISRRLVRAFGGDIDVESTSLGDGTTFLVWLPANS